VQVICRVSLVLQAIYGVFSRVLGIEFLHMLFRRPFMRIWVALLGPVGECDCFQTAFIKLILRVNFDLVLTQL
jgi:hypothetical protein